MREWEEEEEALKRRRVEGLNREANGQRDPSGGLFERVRGYGDVGGGGDSGGGGDCGGGGSNGIGDDSGDGSDGYSGKYSGSDDYRN